MQVYFHRFKLTKNLRAHLKNDFSVQLCPMYGAQSDKQNDKILQRGLYLHFPNNGKKTTKKFTAAADNEKVRRKRKCKGESMY